MVLANRIDALEMNYKVKHIVDNDTLLRIYQQRFAEYNSIDLTEVGYQTMCDMYDFLPNSKTYALFYNQELLASLRMCICNYKEIDHVPILATFGEEIKNIVQRDEIFVEYNFMISTKEGKERGRFIFKELFSQLAIEAMLVEAKYAFIGVRSNHVNIYKRMGYSQLTGPKPYPGREFEVVLLGLSEDSFVLTSLKEDISKLTPAPTTI